MNKFSSHPKSKFWHPVKNGDLSPDKITQGSAKKCWFICDDDKCNHEFESDPNHITALKNPTWCPYCCTPSKKLCENNQDMHCKICFEKSFACYKLPEHIIWSNKNITSKKTLINPCDVSRTSNKKYYFDCSKCKHKDIDIQLSWIKDDKNFPCRYCSSKVLCEDECKSCFEKSFASHEKAVFWDEDNEENKNIKPRDVFKHSGIKYWFICEEGHSFDATLAHISSETEPRWCPYCNGCNEKALECFERSFASHNLSENWDYEKNNGVIPRSVFKGTSDKYWFKCECGHSFDVSLSNISKEKNNRWCPYCCVPPKKLCENNQDGHCKTCFEKSFASHPKSNCFDEKSNGIKASLVFKGDNDNYFFNCDVCIHKFYQSMNLITQGAWCHYCSRHRICEDNDCKTCFEKSFASHEKVAFWDKDKNININPRTIHKQSGKKIWFKCEKDHSFEATIRNLCERYGRPASWCPHCINKTEQKLYDNVVKIYPYLQQQYKVEWCKNKTYLPFDFVLEKEKIIIELDGPQHFRQICDKWRSPEEEQKNDKYKMECANTHDFIVIRLLQEVVFYDTYDWLAELLQNINKIIEDKQTQNIFMCKNNEYSHFQ